MSARDRYVYIGQLLCPARHCVLAIYGEFDSDEDAAILGYKLGEKMGQLVKEKVLRHECHICKSTTLYVEVGRTRFRSMAEATPVLKQSEADQRATAEWLKRGQN